MIMNIINSTAMFHNETTFEPSAYGRYSWSK